MADDDRLLELLGDALDEGVPSAEPDRIDAIRRAASARRDDAGAAAASPPPARRRLPAAVLAAAAAIIVVLVLGVGAFVLAGDDDPAGEVEYAGPISGPGGEGELSVVETGIGRVVEIDTDDLEILPTGEYYEVWFVGPGDSPDTPNRISAGTFHPDPEGRSNVTFAAAVDPTEYPVVEITAEPGDGDPRPSGEVLLRAEIG